MSSATGRCRAIWGWCSGAALLLLLMATPAAAQKVDSSIAIGSSYHVWSDALAEGRRVFVHLPSHYQVSTRRYPVLYVLDAEEQFSHAVATAQFLASNGRVPELIVIGVANTERSRDMTPPASANDASSAPEPSGGADAFLRFLADDLAPWVEARFRSESRFRILFGHSYGGLFALHALLNRPDSFQAHIAVSPSLWWNEQATAKQARLQLRSIQAPHFLYVSWGDAEPTISGPTQDLMHWLEENPPGGVRTSYRYYAGEDHGTTPYRSLYDGLQFVFEDWRIEYATGGELRELDLAQIDAHATALRSTYGFAIEPSVDAIDYVGRILLQKHENAAGALLAFERNALAFPYLASVHESLGDALLALGRRQEALDAYRRAMALAVESESGYFDPIMKYRARQKQINDGPDVQKK